MAAYQRIHCRDQRVFAADDNEFSTSCKCGAVSRPWTELTSFSENKTHFAFNTKMGGQILPKSAFSSEATITEFRALVTGKLNHDRPVTSPHFDFACKPEDFRGAYLLHTVKGGGWRGLAKGLAKYCAFTYGAFVIWRSFTTHNPAILCGLIGAFVGVPVVKIAKQRRKHYLGPLRVYFNDEGLHLQDPTNQSRTLWKQFIGYLENSDIFILYHNPKLYRIIPKRALLGQAGRFQDLVVAKLVRYDYRNPLDDAVLKRTGSTQQAPN